MRAPIYLAALATLAAAAALPLSDGGGNLEAVDVAADPETIDYLLPKLAAKYRPGPEWRDVADPRFYVLTETDSDEQLDNNQRENERQRRQGRARRSRDKRYNASYSPTLSVQAPIQALRNLYDRSNYQQRIFQNRRLINQLSSS